MLATLALLLAVQAPAAPPAPEVHVYSCQVMSGLIIPRQDEIGLAVRFENRSTDSLKSIVWRAKYGSTWVDFIDDGTFSPDTRIDNYLLFEAGKRRFNWFGAIAGAFLLANGDVPPSSPLWFTPNMFPDYASDNDPDTCAIARTVSSDGTLWVNPALADEKPFDFPTPPPKPVTPPTPAPSPTPFASGPLAISQCAFQFEGEGLLSVTYTNTAAQPAKHIVFRIPYRGGDVDFMDDGTFSPHVEIRHRLVSKVPELYQSLAYVPMLHPLDACQVAGVQYADGTAWQNPALPAAEPMATPPPDALDVNQARKWQWQLHGFPTPIPSISPSPGPTPTGV